MVFKDYASNSFLAIKNLKEFCNFFISQRRVIKQDSTDFKLSHLLVLALLNDVNQCREHFFANMSVFNFELVVLNELKDLWAWS